MTTTAPHRTNGRGRPARLIGAIALGAAAALTLSSCAAGASSSESSDIVFTMPMTTTTSMDPVDSVSIDSLLPIRAAYEGLVNEVAGTYDVEPGLATEWSTDDNTTWSFTLREGVTFTDGTAFDSAAVKSNIERYLAYGGQVGGLLSGVTSVETPDDATVVITLDAPNVSFLTYLAKAVIASPTAIEENEVDGDLGHAWLTTNTAGTGPYKSGAAVTGQSQDMDRNEDYWGGWEDDQISTVRFIQTADEATLIQLLERGEVDRVMNIPFGRYLDQLESNPDLNVLRADGTTIDEIQMNTQHGPLANKLVRQAITKAFDYDAAIQSAYDGFATVPAGPVPQGFAAHDDSIPAYAQDIDGAKALLAQSGESVTNLTAWYMDGLAYEEASTLVLADSLAKIGITVDVQAKTWDQMAEAALTPETAPDFNFLWHGAITADPVEYLGSYFQSGYIGGYNWSFFDNAEFDTLLADATSAATVEERDAILATAQQLVVDEAPAVFVTIPEKIEVMSSRFENAVIHPIDYGWGVDFYSLRLK